MTKREEITLRSALKRPKTKEDDQARSESAVRVAEAQLAITKVLATLPSQDARERVLRAVGHIVAADTAVPGIFEVFARGSRQPREPGKPEASAG